MLEHLVDGFKKESGITLKGDGMAIQRVGEAAEKAKIELSWTTQTEINLPFITADASSPKHINSKLMRSQFENLVAPLIQRTVDPCKKALSVRLTGQMNYKWMSFIIYMESSCIIKVRKLR